MIDAKDPSARAALASSGAAVSVAAELLRAARAAWWCDGVHPEAIAVDDANASSDLPLVPFAPLARALRNLCAGNAVARGGACALPHRAAPEALAVALPALSAVLETRDGFARSDGFEENANVALLVEALTAGIQLACNLIAGGGVAGETTWRALFPGAFSAVAKLKSQRAAHEAHPALCAALGARFAKVGLAAKEIGVSYAADRERGVVDDAVPSTHHAYHAHHAHHEETLKVCGFEACESIWRPLLKASVDDAETETETETERKNKIKIKKADDRSGGGEWLFRFVKLACLFSGEAVPALCRGVVPGASETARARDEALRRKLLDVAVSDISATPRASKSAVVASESAVVEGFAVEQATLLDLVALAIDQAPLVVDVDATAASTSTRAGDEPEGTSGPPRSPSVVSEGTCAYVLDLASRAAVAVEAHRWKGKDDIDGYQFDAARVALRACLGVIRSLTEREVEPGALQTERDVVATLCAMGAPRFLLGLLRALPVPSGIGNTSNAKGPTRAPALDPKTFKPVVMFESSGGASNVTVPDASNENLHRYPSSRPWEGYRVDVLAPLANAMFGRPNVCAMVHRLGGTAALLAATRGEDGDEYLREYALWAVRNICAGSDEAREEIESLQPQAAADAHALAAAGLNVDVDPETGKVRVGNVRGGEKPRSSVGSFGKTFSADSAGGASSGTPPRGGGRPPPRGGDRAATRAGRAVQAALDAGFNRDDLNPEDEDDEIEIPKHWKVADLS